MPKNAKQFMKDATSGFVLNAYEGDERVSYGAGHRKTMGSAPYEATGPESPSGLRGEKRR